MSLSFAKAFRTDKPHSSITDWVDRLTAPGIEEEAYDGIPEIVDSINLQAVSGPPEASRALRKKLKHGNPHQQYRALVILKALVENCGQKFQNTFADEYMTDALKMIANDPSVDRRVKKKLMLVLGSWEQQYKDDPSMSTIAGLNRICSRSKAANEAQLANMMGLQLTDDERRRVEEKEAKKRAKREKEEAAAKEAARREHEKKSKVKRVPFDFEKDKPKVQAAILEASQASSNLVNAMRLVNRKTDHVTTNERVQKCLEKTQAIRKPIVRYIQLVENEEFIGTLIETNDRIMTALEMYERLMTSTGDDDEEDNSALAKAMAATQITPADTAVPSSPFDDDGWKGKQRSDEAPLHLHPDLEDLSFGPLGTTSSRLPPPIRPSGTKSDDEEELNNDRRGSLSDFSDYETSDEETHKKNAASTSKRNYVTVSDNEDDTPIRAGQAQSSSKNKRLIDDDPFADPFADK